MIIILPIIWLVVWVGISGVICAFSGISAQANALLCFFAIFLAGGLGLPLVGGTGWFIKRRLEQR